MNLIDDNALAKMKETVDACHAENIRITQNTRNAHWIKGVFANITCSNCDFPLVVPDAMIPKLAYCPHCGAKMEENEDK